jgi:hypothetical protein
MNAAYLMALKSLPDEYVRDGVHVVDVGDFYFAVLTDQPGIACKRGETKWMIVDIQEMPPTIQKYRLGDRVTVI